MLPHLLLSSIAGLPCGSNRAFIDLGANDGQSLTWFERKLLHQTRVPYTAVYAFEMNPYFEEPLQLVLRRLPNGELVRAAAWTRDGTMEANMQLPGSRTAVKGGVLYNMTASALQERRGKWCATQPKPGRWRWAPCTKACPWKPEEQA
ncbi:hypothetical protein AB1Y20_012714 [Prymnesium parvum]|uniref:Methyltransferase FkbM domain-containing protein n=1 Tax=Prymnesium parvum TaxID=97485 RepID=A0AB34ILA1_PRYPA